MKETSKGSLQRVKPLVFGIGYDDSDYPLVHKVFLKGKWVKDWECPFYRKWKDMLMRCYSENT